jgi:hypothetical protein
MSDENGAFVFEELFQVFAAFSGHSAGQNQSVSQFSVHFEVPAGSFDLLGFAEIDLVQAKSGGNLGPVGGDEIAVDEPGLVMRLLERRDHDDLVDIGGDELGPVIPSLRGPAERGTAGQDLVDYTNQPVLVTCYPRVVELLEGIELHIVSHRELASRFVEQTAAEIALVGFEKGGIRTHRTSFTM